jgi:ectoine hydroxylase-related dioxygenase (phytanoyl-CoA dioxygenase family)
VSGASVAPLRESDDLRDDPRALVQRAHDEGYLFLPRLVLRAVVDELRDVALAAAEDLGWLDRKAPREAGMSVPGVALGAHDDPRWVHFLTMVLPDPAFTALRNEPVMRRVVEALLGGPPDTSAGDLCRVVSGDDPAHTTPPHQERHYVHGGGELWIAWLPLTDCPLSLGPLAILPRSHRRGLLPHEDGHGHHPSVDVPSDAVWLASDLTPGDALFFSGVTVHRALPHRDDRRLRLSADFRFQRSGGREPNAGAPPSMDSVGHTVALRRASPSTPTLE